jgi:CRP/FNR family transcriptional regulator, cyclic AMP receptor protein
MEPITRPLAVVAGLPEERCGSAARSLLAPREADQLLRQIPLFKDLDAGEIKAVSSFFSTYRVEAGTVVFREGEPSDHLLIVADGAVRVQKRAYDNVEKILGIVDRGKILGEMALADGGPRSATCVAVKDTLFVTLTRSQFGDILNAHPIAGAKILCRLASSMSRRLRSTSQQLVDYLEV